MNTTSINYELIKAEAIKTSPFPYFGLEHSLDLQHQENLIDNFPKLAGGGSFPIENLTIQGSLKELVDEIKSDKFRSLIANKFSLDLADKPIVITARGHSRGRDGKNHTDSKTKLVTVLIYLNEEWTSKNGRLRILNSDDIDDYTEEFSASFGQMIAFKVTDDCWHGYLPYDGKRQSLQINYLADAKHSKYHLYRHKISAFFKNIFSS